MGGALGAPGLAPAQEPGLREPRGGLRGNLELDAVEKLAQGEEPVDRAPAVRLAADGEGQGGVGKADAVGGLVDLLAPRAASPREALLDGGRLDFQPPQARQERRDLLVGDVEALV